MYRYLKITYRTLLLQHTGSLRFSSPNVLFRFIIPLSSIMTMSGQNVCGREREGGQGFDCFYSVLFVMRLSLHCFPLPSVNLMHLNHTHTHTQTPSVTALRVKETCCLTGRIAKSDGKSRAGRCSPLLHGGMKGGRAAFALQKQYPFRKLKEYTTEGRKMGARETVGTFLHYHTKFVPVLLLLHTQTHSSVHVGTVSVNKSRICINRMHFERGCIGQPVAKFRCASGLFGKEKQFC